MPTDKKHHVFRIEYNGRARELCTEAVIRDPFSGDHLRVARAVWDTGATATAISQTVAQNLKLKPTGVTKISTAGGIRMCNTYVIDIRLPQGVGILGLPVTEADIGMTDVLIGMDVIGLGDFTIQNQNNKTVFEFCLPPFENKYNMLEKADTINKKIDRAKLRNKSAKQRPIPKS